MNNYLEKYLKYKEKYYNLKNVKNTNVLNHIKKLIK